MFVFFQKNNQPKVKKKPFKVKLCRLFSLSDLLCEENSLPNIILQSYLTSCISRFFGY